MTNFNRGGEGMSNRQSYHVNMLSSYQDLSGRLIEPNESRLLHFVSRRIGTRRNDERGIGRNDEMECNDEDRGSLRTTFVQASPLLRPYITHSSPFQYLFNTFASRILDQNVMKTCSEGDETPKLVRNWYGSDPKVADTLSFVPTDYLPYNYDLNRRMQENRKTVTRIGSKRGKYEENQHRLNREGVGYDF